MTTTKHPDSHVRAAAVIVARGALLISLVFAVDHAFAGGKVYRCGNAFQDQPCAAAPADPARTPDKVGARDAAPAAAAHAAPRPGANDRLVLEAPREVVIQARR